MAEGRKSSHATNVNYLLQDYSTSIEYFDKVNSTCHRCFELFIFNCIAFDDCKRI